MAKLVRNLEVIDQTEESTSLWQVYANNDSVEELVQMGLTVSNSKGELEMAPNKTVYKYTDKDTKEEKLFVFKKNSFNPHKGIEKKNSKYLPERRLEISTAVNEYVWSLFIDALSEQSTNPLISQLRTDYVPVTLAVIHTSTDKGDKERKTVSSLTQVQSGFHNKKIIKTYFPEMHEQLSESRTLSTIPINVRLLSALIGKQIKINDIIFNELGEYKILDNGDATPWNVSETINGSLLFEYFDNTLKLETYTQEEIIEYLNTGIEMLNLLILNKDEVVKKLYSLYDKINVIFNPQEKNRPSGLSLYVPIWQEAITIFNWKISEIKGEVSNEQPSIDMNIIIEENPIQSDKPVRKNAPKIQHDFTKSIEIIEAIQQSEKEHIAEEQSDLIEIIDTQTPSNNQLEEESIIEEEEINIEEMLKTI